MSEYMPHPCVYLSQPVSGPPNIARLSFCELIYLFSIVDAAALYLFVERDTVESQVGADRLCEWAVMFARLWDDAFAISETMAHPIRHGAVLGEMPDYGAVFTLTASLPCDFGLLLHCEGL